MDEPIQYYLCPSAALENGEKGVVFDVIYQGHTCRAFAVRYEGHVQAYLNRCAHVAMEMDYREGHFFDQSKRWLICSTHGALYAPQSGQCMGGPCRTGLIKIEVFEKEESVYWLSAYNLIIKEDIFQ